MSSAFLVSLPSWPARPWPRLQLSSPRLPSWLVQPWRLVGLLGVGCLLGLLSLGCVVSFLGVSCLRRVLRLLGFGDLLGLLGFGRRVGLLGLFGFLGLLGLHGLLGDADLLGALGRIGAAGFGEPALLLGLGCCFGRPWISRRTGFSVEGVTCRLRSRQRLLLLLLLDHGLRLLGRAALLGFRLGVGRSGALGELAHQHLELLAGVGQPVGALAASVRSSRRGVSATGAFFSAGAAALLRRGGRRLLRGLGRLRGLRQPLHQPLILAVGMLDPVGRRRPGIARCILGCGSCRFAPARMRCGRRNSSKRSEAACARSSARCRTIRRALVGLRLSQSPGHGQYDHRGRTNTSHLHDALPPHTPP